MNGKRAKALRKQATQLISGQGRVPDGLRHTTGRVIDGFQITGTIFHPVGSHRRIYQALKHAR